MELIEKIQTWWESLGLTAEEANLLDSAIEKQKNVNKSKPVQCTDCSQFYNSSDWHDCAGTYDELRWRLEGKVTNSMKKRLQSKYGKSDQLQQMAEEYLNNLHPNAYQLLESNYQRRVALIESQDPTWFIEEELWNS